MIYQTQLDPFLTQHENEIEDFIASAHDRAKRAGLQYLRRAIEMVKEQVFGMKTQRASSTSSPPKSPVGSYTQNLLARFYLPTARVQGGVPTTADFYNLISSVLGKPTTSSTSGQDVPASGGASSATLFGSTLGSAEERMNYIAVQRERLRGLLQALDKEASNMSTSEETKVQAAQVPLPETPGEERNPTMTMRKNRSEMDFENVEREDYGEEKRTAGGWMPWNWSRGSPKGKGTREAETETARSTGTDVG